MCSTRGNRNKIVWDIQSQCEEKILLCEEDQTLEQVPKVVEESISFYGDIQDLNG